MALNLLTTVLGALSPWRRTEETARTIANDFQARAASVTGETIRDIERVRDETLLKLDNLFSKYTVEMEHRLSGVLQKTLAWAFVLLVIFLVGLFLVLRFAR